MYAGIGPPGDGEARPGLEDPLQRSAYFALDRPQPRLCGPAAEAASVVLESEFEARGLGSRSRRRLGPLLDRAHDRRGRYVVDELEVGRLGAVTRPRPDLHDPGIAAVAIGEPRRHLRKEEMDDLLRAQEGESLPARRQVAAPPERDHLLRDRADGLGLRFGGLDA